MRDSVGITIVNNELIAFPNPFGVFTESHQDEIAYTLLRIISKVVNHSLFFVNIILLSRSALIQS